jgi:hypothetical protein
VSTTSSWLRDIEAAVSRYETIYGMSVTTRAEEAATSMKMAFFRFADTYTVLVSSSDEKGRIAIWVNERGESVWIVARRVDDITGAVAELRDKGAPRPPSTACTAGRFAGDCDAQPCRTRCGAPDSVRWTPIP